MRDHTRMQATATDKELRWTSSHPNQANIVNLSMCVTTRVQATATNKEQLQELEDAVISGAGLAGPHLNVDLEQQREPQVRLYHWMLSSVGQAWLGPTSPYEWTWNSSLSHTQLRHYFCVRHHWMLPSVGRPGWAPP